MLHQGNKIIIKTLFFLLIPSLQTINFGKERQMNMIMDDGGELTATTMKNTPNIWEGIRGISEETATGK